MRRSIRALLTALAVGIILPAAVLAHWPVADKTAYVSQGYHSYHQANDLAAPLGTYVVPIRSGRVVYAGWKNNCGGYQVWISHGNGLYSGYYHLSKVLAYKGQWVTDQVTKIGRVGMSGCASGTHVHFEVWRGYPWSSGSYRVNPWAYIDSGTYLPYKYR